MEIDEELTVYNILENVGSYPTIHQRAMKSATLNDAIFNSTKALSKTSNPPSPKLANENDKKDMMIYKMKE